MDILTYDSQPYGIQKIEINNVAPVVASGDSEDYIKCRASEGWVEITGTVIEGRTASRGFGHTSHRDLKGEKVTLQMPRTSYDKRYHITVAM